MRYTLWCEYLAFQNTFGWQGGDDVEQVLTIDSLDAEFRKEIAAEEVRIYG